MKTHTLRPLLAFAALALVPLLAIGPAMAETLSTTRINGGTITRLSADGRAATGTTNRTYEAFRWTAESGLVRLGRGTALKLGKWSGVPSISADGTVVAATILSDDGLSSTAGRWTQAGGWQALRPLPADGGSLDNEDSSVFGLSADGRVPVGLYWRPNQSGGIAHAMRWSAESGMQGLGSSGASSRGDAASADGSVIAGWDENPNWGNRRAAVWVNGVRTVLEDSEWTSEAVAVSRDGRIVVGNAADPNNNFQTSAVMWRWQDGAWVKTVLGVITNPGAVGAAFAGSVSDDGAVVVGIDRPDMFSRASIGFIWTPAGGLVDIAAWMQANGLTLGPLQRVVSAPAVSADGSTIAVVVQNRKTGTLSSMLIRRAP